MKLPKELTTVTRFSIILSGICFIVFVILAFFLGMQYQQVQDLTEEQLINMQSIALTQQKPTTITVSPSSALATQSVLKNSPSGSTQAFYQWYVDCLNNASVSDCNYNTNKYVSSKLVERITAYDKNFKKQCGNSPGCSHGDLILCAQNVPQSVSVDNEKITGDNATVTVHTLWGAGDNVPLTVSLANEGTWKITNIACSKYSL